ncbi:sensor domain-containing diguanylate cyclase [Paenibacillus cymbidii]|uniref:sensor domain-containing diguanylate cyclase n=1 Tax=Paenibacillus cymbidii TaxID=1639034 RepID=UPI0010813389|nr:diguanylate cyclase [Paenibacillus cymbidii]
MNPHKSKSGYFRSVSLVTLFSGLVSLSVVLTLTILLIASYQSKKQSLIATTLSLNDTNADKLSQTMDSILKSMRGGLQYTVSLLSREFPMNDGQMFEQIELMRRSSNYFNGIVVVDETGVVRSISPRSESMLNKAVTTEASLEALASRKPYVSKPYPIANGKLIVFMSEPFFDQEGNYKGFVGGTIYLQENNIMNMIFGSNMSDDNGTYYYVVESEGHLIYHPDKTRLGEDVRSNSVVRKLTEGISGKEQTVNTRGGRLLAGYSVVPETGWGVVVVSPLSEVYEQLNRHIRSMLLYMLPPFVLLLIGANWLARRLARPFVTMANLVGGIGRGKIDPGNIETHWNREANMLGKTIRLAMTDLKKRTDDLTRDAMTDPLTGLLNRRTLETTIKSWVERRTAFSIVIMDIDKFKAINDTYGHAAGDEVLKALAEVASTSIRPGDIICRYGGEELVALLALTSAGDAFAVAERIRQRMEAAASPVGQTVTVSLGVAHFPSQADSAEAVFDLADRAMYRAKSGGRNRTVAAE